MTIGREYDIVQRRTGLHYRVNIIRDMKDGRFVGLTLTNSAQWSAGAQIAINPDDIIMEA